MVYASFLIDLQRRMNKRRPAVIGRPTAILNVFGTPSDQVGPRLADRKNFIAVVLSHGDQTRWDQIQVP
jgi:hypothetical protein